MKPQKESQIVEVVNMLLKKKHFSGSTNQTSSLFTFQKKNKKLMILVQLWEMDGLQAPESIVGGF